MPTTPLADAGAPTSAEAPPAKPPVPLIDPRTADKRLRLWPWFLVVYPSWLLALAGLAAVGYLGRRDGLMPDFLWRLAGLTFYLSLACNFIPLPTSPAISIAAALDLPKAQAGWQKLLLLFYLGSLPVWPHILLVAVAGAAGTMMANLNEYHIWTFALRSRKIAAVRHTRIYRTAVKWFARAPWWTMAAFTFLITPVDVIRLLAITFQYPRCRFATACFFGRFLRYGLLAWTVAYFGKTQRSTLVIVIGITVLTVGAGLTVGLPRIYRAIGHMLSRRHETEPEPDAGC